ncbi:MAG: DUF1624 domain-containing protein [Oscillospiraceae bacterium]|jgi:uncharacterized membrane protein|nr:DUF1624 domain-containing protein [Oscillospiraceae bacterium]
MSESVIDDKKKRIELIDALRGFAVSLMVIHHALYDMAAFLDAPWWLYRNPLFDFLQYIFVGVFIAVSGVSSRFSRGNVERGSIVIVIAVIITYITVRMDMPIYFGILHLLGLFMLFYGLSRRLIDKIPRRVAPFLYIALIIITALMRGFYSPVSDNPVIRDLLSVLGWRQQGFVSYDYQAILPWIFVFLFGTWAGKYIREGRFPTWFYEMKVPFFPLVGRNALLIYVTHQPVLYGVTMVILHW